MISDPSVQHEDFPKNGQTNQINSFQNRKMTAFSIGKEHADEIEAQVRLAYERTNLDYAKDLARQPARNGKRRSTTADLDMRKVIQQRSLQRIGRKTGIDKYKNKFGMANNINLMEMLN